MVMTSQQAVARIAYLASDVVVDALPRDPTQSLFQHTFAASTSAKVISVRHGADPGSVLPSRKDAILASLTVSSSKDVLTHLIPHLSELASRPLVLHVTKDGDLSDGLALRASIPFVLHSSSAQQAHDHALLASRLARLERKAVLHMFHVSQEAEDVVEVEVGKVQHLRRRSRIRKPKL